VIEMKTNQSPVVIDKTAPRETTLPSSPSFSFPVGYHDRHADISINVQLNRFYNWVGDDSMLTEMRETLGGVTDYPTFTKLVLDLGEKALARHELQIGPGASSSRMMPGDGTIVVVPLPGHIPGHQGMFLKLGRRRVFLLGDAADILEAAERGLPKSAPIRTNTDF